MEGYGIKHLRVKFGLFSIGSNPNLFICSLVISNGPLFARFFTASPTNRGRLRINLQEGEDKLAAGYGMKHLRVNIGLFFVGSNPDLFVPSAFLTLLHLGGQT